MSQEQYRRASIEAVKKLSKDVGIPVDLKNLVKKEDIPFLAQSAFDDVVDQVIQEILVLRI